MNHEEVNDAPHVFVMCKAPVAGRVKTRLMTLYSAGEACDIHRAMAETVIERAARLFFNVSIAADDISHPFFERFGLPVVEQGEGDLGARMSRLMRQAFDEGAGSVLFLGTDSPHMAESRLADVVARLGDHDVVIGPVADGGYDLIAMSKPAPELFEGIAWGSEHVLRQSLERAKGSGVSVALLDQSFDLDTPESLERVKALWQPPLSV